MANDYAFVIHSNIFSPIYSTAKSVEVTCQSLLQSHMDCTNNRRDLTDMRIKTVFWHRFATSRFYSLFNWTTITMNGVYSIHVVTLFEYNSQNYFEKSFPAFLDHFRDCFQFEWPSSFATWENHQNYQLPFIYNWSRYYYSLSITKMI
jgi:hypothetical protein